MQVGGWEGAGGWGGVSRGEGVGRLIFTRVRACVREISGVSHKPSKKTLTCLDAQDSRGRLTHRRAHRTRETEQQTPIFEFQTNNNSQTGHQGQFQHDVNVFHHSPCKKE